MSKIILSVILCAISILLGGIFSDIGLIGISWAFRFLFLVLLGVSAILYLDSGGKNGCNKH
jgi:hypothetical protein